MTNIKKIGRKIFFPSRAVMFILIPISFALLIYSLIFNGTESIVSYVGYTLSFYSLLIFCLRIPDIIKKFKKIKNENKYIQLYLNDEHLRINISLYFSILINVAYSILQLGLGFKHNSFWYYTMAISYVVFSLMRIFLLKHLRAHKVREAMLDENKKSLLCGFMLIIIAIAFLINVFFMIYWNKTFYFHMITTILMATYTFISLAIAIINLIKYRKFKSPVYFSAKMLGLIAGCISMITLETTMLTTFGNAEDVNFRNIILGTSGGVVLVFIVVVAIIMIIKAKKEIRKINASIK